MLRPASTDGFDVGGWFDGGAISAQRRMRLVMAAAAGRIDVKVFVSRSPATPSYPPEEHLVPAIGPPELGRLIKAPRRARQSPALP